MKVIDPSKKPGKRIDPVVGEKEDIQLQGSSLKAPELTELPMPSKQLGLRMKALRLYLQTGSLAQVSQQLSIPIYHLRQLSKTIWWERELELIRRDAIANEQARLTKIWNRTLEEIEDRLEHGDEVIGKNGRKVRQQLSASTLARIADTVFDKRQVLRGEPTTISSGNKKLEELAEKLTALGRKQQLPKVIDQEEVVLEEEQTEEFDWGEETDENGQENNDCN